MSLFKKESEALQAIARMVRKGGFAFDAASCPSATIGSKNYKISEVFYEPEVAGICCRVVDEKGRTPDGILSVRWINSLSIRDIRRLADKVKEVYGEAMDRNHSLKDIVRALAQTTENFIDFRMVGPTVMVPDKETGDMVQARVERVCRAVGSSQPGIVIAKDAEGGRHYTDALYLSTADLSRIAASRFVSSLVEKASAVESQSKNFSIGYSRL